MRELYNSALVPVSLCPGGGAAQKSQRDQLPAG